MNKKAKELREKLLQMNQEEFQNLIDDTVEYSNKQIANFNKNGWLRFNPELIRELAKPFTSAAQMNSYEGENEDQIKAASKLIDKGVIERPEWFIENKKNNAETDEECIEILSKVSTIKEIYDDSNYLRLLHRLWLHNSKEDVDKMLPHLNKKRRHWDDDSIYEIISQYSLIKEIRKVKEHKKFLTKLQVDKGVKYPKSYALYLTMKTKNGGEGPRKKRGKYKKK